MAMKKIGEENRAQKEREREREKEKKGGSTNRRIKIGPPAAGGAAAEAAEAVAAAARTEVEKWSVVTPPPSVLTAAPLFRRPLTPAATRTQHTRTHTPKLSILFGRPQTFVDRRRFNATPVDRPSALSSSTTDWPSTVTPQTISSSERLGPEPYDS